MLLDVGIKTFVRLDENVMDVLFPHVTLTKHVKDHWVYWMLPTEKVTPQIKDWLDHQGASAWTTTKFIGVDFLVQHNEPTDAYTYLTIGISLSGVTEQQVARMLNDRRSFSIVPCDLAFGDFNETKPPLLFTKGDANFLYAQRIVKPIEELIAHLRRPPNLELEKKFLDSLIGHDFWTDYSDSPSVRRRGDAEMNRLKAEGIEMGLSKADVDRLYTQKANELSKR